MLSILTNGANLGSRRTLVDVVGGILVKDALSLAAVGESDTNASISGSARPTQTATAAYRRVK